MCVSRITTVNQSDYKYIKKTSTIECLSHIYGHNYASLLYLHPIFYINITMFPQSPSRHRQSINNCPIKYYKQEQAFAVCKRDQRVWACDTRNCDDSVGKYFIVMGVKDFYEYMKRGLYGGLHFYEIISEDNPCRFHLDIECGVLSTTSHSDNASESTILMKKRLSYMFDNDTNIVNRIYNDYVAEASKDWYDDVINKCGQYLHGFCNSFVEKELDVVDKTQIGGITLTSSRTNKLSFHYINQHLVLDRNTLSMRYLSWKISRKIWIFLMNDRQMDLLEDFDNNSVNRRATLRLLMLEQQCDDLGWKKINDTPIDEMIYTRNRQFRIIYNSEMTKDENVPLVGMKKYIEIYPPTSDKKSCLSRMQNVGFKIFESTLVGGKGLINSNFLYLCMLFILTLLLVS